MAIIDYRFIVATDATPGGTAYHIIDIEAVPYEVVVTVWDRDEAFAVAERLEGKFIAGGMV